MGVEKPLKDRIFQTNQYFLIKAHETYKEKT